MLTQSAAARPAVTGGTWGATMRSHLVGSGTAVALGVALLLPSTGAAGQDSAALEDARVFVNEIHYANGGVDVGEFVEVAGPAGTPLAGVEVVLYDGETGRPYARTPLTGAIGPNGVAVIDYPVDGLPDGPDALALVDGDGVAEFLSWGGEVTAVDGPAAGLTSADLGVAENEQTPAASSLQLVGTGDSAEDLAWTGPAADSRGAPNAEQSLTFTAPRDAATPDMVTDELEPGTVVDTTVAPSDPANELLIEGESLVPTATGTPVVSQRSTGLLVWSGDRQLRVNAVEPFEAATVTFQVPRAGRYQMSADMTAGQNFGVAALALDGAEIGQFDGSGTRNTLRRRVALGEHDLTAGDHTLTLTVVRAGSGGLYRIGLDLLRFRLQPAEGRLTLTPWRADSVAGTIPVYGWSTDAADRLSLQVDRQDVVDWEAVAQSATLEFEAQGIDAGPSGDDFADGMRVRGRTTILTYDVGTATAFATHGLQVSGELLVPGENVVTLFTDQDPAKPAGSNKDDFQVRNVHLVLADGTRLKDPSKPDGTAYRLNDSVVSRDWTFTLPPPADAGPRYTPARGFELDTRLLSDGDHVVTLTAEGPAGTQKLNNRITVDNRAPVVSALSPADGAQVKGPFTLDATVTDEGDRRPHVRATLDGTPVELGSSLSTDDLADGPHVFTVVATDAAGGSGLATSRFTTVGETPDAPQLVAPGDGSTGVATDARLSVQVSDPADEPLRVSFLRATPAGPPVLGRAGATLGEVPAPSGAAGTPVDLAAVAEADDVYVDSPPTPDTPYQRYDVQVTRVRGAKTVDLSWEGRVAADREVALSVWDMDAQRWTEVAVSRGADGADTTLVGRTRLGPALDGDVVHVLVEARDLFTEIPSSVSGFEDPDAYDFALAWMTDTQYLVQGGEVGTKRFMETFAAMPEWVKNETPPRKIVYSAHTGDVINNWQIVSTNEDLARRQYAFASDTMAVLDDNGVPNGITPGNHDNKNGADNGLFNEFFGPMRYDAAEDIAPTGEDAEGYYGGPWQPDDNDNHFDLVEAGGQRFLLLYLGYFVKPEEIAWANQVLAEHRDRKAIVLTHSYLTPSNAPDGRGGELAAADGREIFDEVVLPNENVFLVLSGHAHGVGRNIKRDVGVKGRTVVEIMANHQFYEIDGLRLAGYVRLLQFDLDAGQLYVDTYAPYTGDFNPEEFDTRAGRDYLDEADEFVVPVDLPSRTTSLRTDTVGVAVRTDTEIGSVSVASGSVAELTWSGLATGTKYGWYARATDPFGFSAESTAFSFTTAR